MTILLVEIYGFFPVDYAKDGGEEKVWPLCSFYHDLLQCQRLRLVMQVSI